jgi:uncharacterized protein
MNDEKLWQFPCEFPLKIFGKPDAEFETFVLSVVRKYVGELKENCIEARPSKNNNYLALTIKITATSKEQLDAIYTELSTNKLVLMVL